MGVYKRPTIKQSGQKQYWYIRFYEDSGKRDKDGRKIYINHSWSVGEVGKISKKEAEIILDQAKAKYGSNLIADEFKSEKITLKQWFNRVLDHKKNVLKNVKWLEDKKSASRFTEFLDKDFDPRRLSVSLVDQYKAWRGNQKYRGKAISPRTINIDLSFVRNAWNLGKKWGYFDGDNPFALAGMLKTSKRLELPLSDTEIETLWKYLPIKERRVFIQETNSAMRIGEIVKAKKENLGMIGESPVVIIKRPKEKKDKIIPLGDAAVANILESINDNNDTEYIFIDSGGTPYKNARKVNEAINRVCKKHGLRHITTHDFRKTWATRASYSGVNTRQISDMLGHADTKVTEDRYILFDPSKIEVANIVKYDYSRFVVAKSKEEWLEMISKNAKTTANTG